MVPDAPEPIYHARVRYTEPMVRKAVRVFVWRALRRSFALLILAVCLLVTTLVFAKRLGPSFAAGFALASLLFILVFVAALWRAHFNNTVGRFRALDPPEADVTLGPTEITLVSNQGAATLPWSRFTGAWAFPDFWMLFLADNQFITLPTASLSPEALAYVQARLAPHPPVHEPAT